jgi:hypothetical protein
VIQSLHDLYNNEYARLKTAYEGRERARIEREAYLKANPPHITDQPIVARMQRIGIEAGKPFDVAKADPAVRRALERAAPDALKAMQAKVPTIARVVNGWQMNTETMGVYGNYYLKRAIVAQLGLGANLPEDAIYPMNLGDSTGKPLDGANNYSLLYNDYIKLVAP